MPIPQLPTSLYIHIPWCRRKCPYCDFNSCAIDLTSELEQKYIQTLCQDLDNELEQHNNPKLSSIYIGGGTPTLLHPNSIATLLGYIHRHCQLDNNIEISIEANPGTINTNTCHALKNLGINRLSIGAQSFQDAKLKTLGRIHNSKDVIKTLNLAQKNGFDNINLDIMYALPNQSLEDAIYDLQQALALKPTHISWYQLTLEEGTPFAQRAPANIPNANQTNQIETIGKEILARNNFTQYEVSAYAQNKLLRCQHNLNYWQFGDYIAIGAGAHGKLTTHNSATDKLNITRYAKLANYKNYLQAVLNNKSAYAELRTVSAKELPLEFMLNTLRLNDPITIDLFTKRTGLPIDTILSKLKQAQQLDFLTFDDELITTTSHGRRFLNDLLLLFM